MIISIVQITLSFDQRNFSFIESFVNVVVGGDDDDDDDEEEEEEDTPSSPSSSSATAMVGIPVSKHG